MKTVYFAATSLDGYIADKNNSLDWLFKFGPPADEFIERFVNTIGAIAMGSATYEWILQNNKGPWPYQVPCFVFTSRKIMAVHGADIRFVNGDVKPVHQQMMTVAKEKDLWVMGGGELAGKFYDAELLNEIQIQVVSLTLMGGAALFPRATKKPLKLKKIVQMGPAAVDLTYDVQY